MDLTERLLASSEREIDGSRTLDRYDFQTHWGVLRLMELHGSGQDYAVAFEFHDDIVVIDNVRIPGSIAFFQVKGKLKGKWSLRDLTKRDAGGSGPKPSIIGKLFSNRVVFGDGTAHLGFVSNQPASFLDDDKAICRFADAENFNTFLSSLKAECPVATDEDASLFHFHHTECGVRGYERHVKGAMVEFITRQVGQPINWDCEAFYLTVIDYCRRQSKNLADLTSLDDLLASKFVTREEVNEWIANLVDRARNRPDWSQVSQELIDWGAPRKRDVRRQWDLYSVERIRVGDRSMDRFKDAIRAAVDGPLRRDASLPEIVEELLPAARAAASRFRPAASDDWLRAAILYEFHA